MIKEKVYAFGGLWNKKNAYVTDNQNLNVNLSVKGNDVYGNREFHVQFWSMIYEAMKFTLSVLEIEF